MSRIDDRIEKLGLRLPEMAAPAGSYVPFVRSGNLLFVSGQVPFGPDGKVITGRVGQDLSLDEAQNAARCCGLGLIAVLQGALSSLDQVKRVVRLGGFVNSGEGFAAQPQVINGCSDLMIEVWGDLGRHARAAVGVSSLPLNAAVEIDGVFEVGECP